jgi:hypothetical protein
MTGCGRIPLCRRCPAVESFCEFEGVAAARAGMKVESDDELFYMDSLTVCIKNSKLIIWCLSIKEKATYY